MNTAGLEWFGPPERNTRDAKVQQIDFVLTFCDVFDGDVFVAGCGLLSGGGFVLRSCRRCCRVCRSGSSVYLLLRRHVVWRGVSNRRVGAKLLVESASGMDEHYNSEERAHQSKIITSSQKRGFAQSKKILPLYPIQSHQCTGVGYL